MVDYREIIRLKSTKPEMSNKMIASSSGSSRSTVAGVWKLVQEKRLSWPEAVKYSVSMGMETFQF